jgi:hypothetical protein
MISLIEKTGLGSSPIDCHSAAEFYPESPSMLVKILTNL